MSLKKPPPPGGSALYSGDRPERRPTNLQPKQSNSIQHKSKQRNTTQIKTRQDTQRKQLASQGNHENCNY